MLTKLYTRTKSLPNCLLTKASQLFCSMPHFREMARKLNITVPKINSEILLQNQQICTVYGIKEIDPNFIHKITVEEEIDQKENKQKRTEYFDEETVSAFCIDKSNKLTIEFNLTKRIAQNLDLDICLMKQSTQIISESDPTNQPNNNSIQLQQPAILSLSRFREYVYRQYYVKELRNKSKRKYIESQLTSENLLNKQQWSPNTKGSYKNRIKTVRIGEDVHLNDLNYKKSQIDIWIGQGERIIKVISHNDSPKSYKALQKFCSMLGKEVQIVEEKIKNKDVRKKPIVRYTATLVFEEQIQIDIEFINKRWRRREAEIKLMLQGKTKKASMFNVDFTKQDYATQKAYLAAFDQAGIPYPKEYDFLTKSDQAFQKQGIVSVIKQVSEEIEKKIKDENIDPYEDDVMTEEQRRRRDRENRRIMEMRTMEDILEEMEEMKSREYEMEQFESEKYKELEQELTDMLKNARKYTQKRQN